MGEQSVSSGRERSLANLRPWKKGESGNLGGPPRGFARLIRDQTKDGEELVTFALGVLRGTLSVRAKAATVDDEGNLVQSSGEPSIKERLEALKWLADRGWGKSVETVELTGNGKSPLEGMTADALLKLAKID